MRITIMKWVLVIVLAAVVLAPTAGAAVSLSEKAALQAAMQRHIDRSLINGVYLHMDFPSASVRPLHPSAAHPMIVRLGEYFVLCSDFLDESGKEVDIDFYMTHDGKRFAVFEAQVANRKALAKLIKAGKAKVVK